MAIDQTRMSIARENVSQRPVTVPPGDILTSTTTLEQLKVPDSVLLSPQSVGPFLAGQYARMKDITERPLVKMESGSIPEYIFGSEEHLGIQSVGLSSDERASLTDWHNESFGDGTHSGSLIQTQSGSVDLTQLEQDMEKHIHDMQTAHPEYFNAKSGSGGGTGNATSQMLEQMMTGNMVQETEEERKRFWDAMAAAKGNPEAVNSIIGFRYAQKAMKIMGKVVEAYSYQVQSLDHLQAAFDLQSSKGNVTQAQMIDMNIKSGSLMGDINSMFQVLQKSMTDYQRVTDDTHTTNKDIAQSLENILRNLRGG